MEDKYKYFECLLNYNIRSIQLIASGKELHARTHHVKHENGIDKHAVENINLGIYCTFSELVDLVSNFDDFLRESGIGRGRIISLNSVSYSIYGFAVEMDKDTIKGFEDYMASMF